MKVPLVAGLFAGAMALGLVGAAYDYYADAPRLSPVTRDAAAYETAPDISFTTLDGATHRLADYRGKTVILHFWATWCAPCVTEFPALVQFAAQMADRDVVLITLSSDLQTAHITGFLERQSTEVRAALALPSILTAEDKGREITRETFMVSMYPETVLINADGQMVRKIAGDFDWTKKGEDALRPLLPHFSEEQR